MKHLWIYLLPIILFSCKEDKQSHYNTQPKQRTPYKDSTWVYHELKLRKDIGTISFYLPKEYSIFNHVDSHPTDWMCGGDLCDLINIYEFSAAHTNSTITNRWLEKNHCFTITYNSFVSCDSEKLRKLNITATKWVEKENDLIKGSMTRYIHIRSDSMNIGRYPYYTSCIKDMPFYHNNNYLYNSHALIIVNNTFLNLSLLYHDDKKYEGNFEQVFDRIMSTVQIK